MQKSSFEGGPLALRILRAGEEGAAGGVLAAAGFNEGQGGEGAGLGLAICREIIKRLQGDISYLTEVSGTGFRVELPLAQSGA